MKRFIYWLMGLFGCMGFHLQVFADNLQVTTSEGLTPEMKTFYDMTLIDEATPKLVHHQFGQKRPIPKGGGKTIEFRKFSPLAKALTPLTEGVTPDGKTLTVTAITATISQYGDYITQSDVLELTAIDPIIAEATKLLGSQAGLTMDSVVRNIMQSGTNVSYCPKLSTDASTGAVTETEVTSRADLDESAQLTVDMVKRAVTKLKRQNAPMINGSYVAIIHPDVTYDLTSDPHWEDWHKYTTAENMYEGEIGKIFGCRFVETTEAEIYTGESCPSGLAVYGTLFFGANAYGVVDIAGGGLEMIVKQKGSAGTADPLDQRSSEGWKAIQTAKILVENYLVRVESCSKRFSATAAAN